MPDLFFSTCQTRMFLALTVCQQGLPFNNIIFSFKYLEVSEKRWYWLKAFALATVRDWDALEKFSKEKRPPGGELPSLVKSSPDYNLDI